jgi:hypothetical protein
VGKSRSVIENQGFNEDKNWHEQDHIQHHHPASLRIHWLLVMFAFALTLERLFRLRYLHRGNHRPRSALALVCCFRLGLGTPIGPDSG